MADTRDAAERILFTTKDGARSSFEDVASDGLDGGYENRIPALRELVRGADPYHALLACGLLVAWGQPEGFAMAIRWATDPARTPWASAPVMYHRLSGADSAFEFLADMIRTSAYSSLTPATEQLRMEMLQYLLALYDRSYFDSTLALAIMRLKVEQQLAGDICAAFDQCLPLLEAGRAAPFDLAFQLACLLLALGRVDDAHTARYAEALLRCQPRSERMLRELVQALALGRGAATLRVLERLRDDAPSFLQADVAAALRRRSAP